MNKDPFSQVLLDFHYPISFQFKVYRDYTSFPGQYSNETRFFPMVYLLADKVLEIGVKRTEQCDFIGRLATESNEYTVFEDIQDHLGYTIFSPESRLKRQVLQQKPADASLAILVLAAAGLEVTLPNLHFDHTRTDELVKIKNSLTDECQEYRNAIIEIADESYDRLVARAYGDIVEWAENEAMFKILPKAQKLQQAIRKADRKLLARIRYGFFQEGIPAIGSALLDGGFREATKEAIKAMLKVLSSNLFLRTEERKAPEVVYGIKVGHALPKSGYVKQEIRQNGVYVTKTTLTESDYVEIAKILIASIPGDKVESLPEGSDWDAILLFFKENASDQYKEKVQRLARHEQTTVAAILCSRIAELKERGSGSVEQDGFLINRSNDRPTSE